MARLRAVVPVALLSSALGAGCLVDPGGEGDAPTLGDIQQAVRGDRVCAGDGPLTYGIDVSRFQGDMDWQKVADSGVEFAWIQISRDFDSLDPKFEYNWRRAKEVGILRGAYQRFSPGRNVAAQAQLFLDTLGPFQAGDLPPMIDVEDADGRTPAQIAAAVQEWIDIVEGATGVKPVIYTGYYFWQDSVGNADFTDYPLWTANYFDLPVDPATDCPYTPRPWETWNIWQYSSSARIPGVTANTVDVNFFQGTREDLLALAGPAECGDGVCSGGETADSCFEDCPPCQVIEASGGIVDDASACFTAGGSPEFIRQEAAGHDGGLKWTMATDSDTAANYGLWDLYFAEGGRYKVEAYTAAPHAESKQAVYRVSHGGQETAAEVDQSAVDGWNLVGEIEFAAGGGQSIRVDDNTGEPNDAEVQIVFDALRFTRLDGGDDGDPDVDDGDDIAEQTGGRDLTSGCAAGGGSSPGPAALLLFAAVLLGLRRRRP